MNANIHPYQIKRGFMWAPVKVQLKMLGMIQKQSASKNLNEHYRETRNWPFCDNTKMDILVDCKRFCFRYFQEDVEVEDIKKFKAVLMESFDTNKDGKIGKDELKLLLVAQKS